MTLYLDESSIENKCECKNLYYDDKSRGSRICLDQSITKCENQIDYPYLIEEEKKCSDICDGIISLDGTICYDSSDDCTGVTKSRIKNGVNECFCKYKYYYKTSEKKDLICLEENQLCSAITEFNRKLLINETNECVEFCPFEVYTKKFGNTCVSSCPELSEEINGECKCLGKWHEENEQISCVVNCPAEKSLLFEDTQKCVSSCKETDHPVFYRGKCYNEDINIDGTKKIDGINQDTEPSGYEGYNLKKIMVILLILFYIVKEFGLKKIIKMVVIQMKMEKIVVFLMNMEHLNI